MSHEIVSAMAEVGLPLCRALVEMLDDHMSHCTERRGCGYTQATRFLSTFVNQPRSPIQADELSIFSHWPQQETEVIARSLVNAGWGRGWRGAEQANQEVLDSVHRGGVLSELQSLLPRVRSARERVALVESQIFLRLVEDILSGDGRAAPNVTGMTHKPTIGSCTQAEEYFLEIAHGRIRRGGAINIFVDERGIPVIVEKMNLGESHSGMVVSPLRIFGVWIPPGSLCALKYPEETNCLFEISHGKAFSLRAIHRLRFLRLTTMAVPPEARQRAFSVQLKAQIRTNMLSPLHTTIEQLFEFALTKLSES